MSNIVYIALGSNIEPRLDYLTKAKTALSKLGIITKSSTIYETAPLTLPNQSSLNWYLNQVICFAVNQSPQQLLFTLKNIEHQLGRNPNHEHWADREIDLDILLYNDEIIDTVSLHIPHLELANRRFVLEPLAEIAPDLIEPRSKKTIKGLLNELPLPLTPSPNRRRGKINCITPFPLFRGKGWG
ncbi:MAG: 2-amino-4-hydroxy-6-hydroxymethyldihydropteridine diphosphokinase [Patescibacteria group bacterium]|jgi:2-amino-4-hydroxy-6-hydroxymethyldihydropteridine diphosphokinase